MRTFVAIEVSSKDVLNSIHKIQTELNIKAKPVELHNMHFTVQFLGEVSEEMAVSYTHLTLPTILLV